MKQCIIVTTSTTRRKNKMTTLTNAFETELEVNNHVCVLLRAKGLPTTMKNRFIMLKELSISHSCEMFTKVFNYYAKNHK